MLFRFVSYSCLKFLEVTDDDKGELFTCTNCKKHHSKLKAKLNLKETNFLNLTEIPFSQHVPISRLSQKRVITTVQVHHKKYDIIMVCHHVNKLNVLLLKYKEELENTLCYDFLPNSFFLHSYVKFCHYIF